jgi:hypothetical protein
MVAATGLSDDSRKWMHTNRGEGFIGAAMRRTGKSRDEVFMTINGGPKRGTWANIYLAFDIANWMCPDFGIMVYDIVLRVMHGDLSLTKQIVEQHDKLNDTKTNLGIVAPGAVHQEYEAVVTSMETKTMSPAQVDAQVDLNNQVASYNRHLERAIDCTTPLTLKEVYCPERDKNFNLVINKAAVTGANVERALAALYPMEFNMDTTSTMYDLVEQMWYKIAWFQDDAEKTTAAAREQKSNPEQEEIIDKQRNAIKNLRVHIENLTVMHKLRPWIESLMKPKPKSRKQRSAYDSHNEPTEDENTDLGAICDLLNEVFHGTRIDQQTINHLNWHMTSKLGHEYKSHIDFRNLVAVVTDMTDIFRADLTNTDYIPKVNRTFGNIFADMDEQMQFDQSPMYYHSLLADVESFEKDTSSSSYDMQSSYGDSSFGDVNFGEVKSSYGETDSRASTGRACDASSVIDPSDPYASVSIHIGAKKKSSAPSRSRVVKKACDLSDELRASLASVFNDRANATPLVMMKSRDPQTLNIYFGQEGYAFRIAPRIISSVPRIVLVVTLGEILEAPAFHLRPGGQITLMESLTSQKALMKLASANLPVSKTIEQEIFILTRDYAPAPGTILIDMIRIIVTAIGATNITSVTYPQDPLGRTWSVGVPESFAR